MQSNKTPGEMVTQWSSLKFLHSSLLYFRSYNDSLTRCFASNTQSALFL
ncbi:hypothetical protein FQN60_007767 [Etheostoma spectabile]|uniref:Uncharacterized protein n=1 Tax=Etheostoma spectabile TaxID=54343 RepID=A0A5J5CUN7_9PERO|nr:hypothetical protein FQN60_007767 [Etheostoma spectabile]